MPFQKLLCSHEYEEQAIYMDDNEVRERCANCGDERLRTYTEAR